ncbi:MAG: SDR family oxidoreductase [Saprospiraceae bacterium]|jgi:NAD(P)-dependent dehydrogenase (short-subunit alcohol dehydrogenase family)|nr:SDR family oxidoreductase [Saprospiraceae bacterium]
MSKKVLVTGASGAFGSLTCKSLSQKGYQVIGTMRSTKDKNESIAQELQRAGVKLVEIDLTEESSVNNGVAKTIEVLGGLDIVFNNAGLGANGIQEMFTVKDMQRVFDVNVFGMQRLMRAVLPHFRKQGKGTILHTSSCIGRVTTPFLGVYCASKYALESLAEGYRAELSGFGIESCIIEPGGMPTAFMGGMLRPSDETRNQGYGDMVHSPDASLKSYIDYIKTNPKQSPQAVADTVAALLEMPYGEKPFRIVVDFMGLKEPIENYNKALDQVTQQIYTANGVDNLLNLNKN